MYFGKSESEQLRTRLAEVRRRTEQAYLDKLDGKITEVFWATKSSELNQEEQILMALAGWSSRAQRSCQTAPEFWNLRIRSILFIFNNLPKKRNCSELYFRTTKSTLQVLSHI